jgi:hypothetical protein
MKKIIFILLIFFFLPSVAHAATEFVSIVDTGGASDSDYSSLSTWETAIGTNLTAPSTIVFSGIVSGTAPADGTSVILYRSGASVGVGATVVHTAKTGTQILLKNVSNPSYGFTNGDEWRIDASNLFTINATAPDQPQVTAKCRATTGAADTAALSIGGWSTDATHYIKIWADPNENYRHQGKWDNTKYRIESGANPVVVAAKNIIIDGLQIYGEGTSTSSGIIWVLMNTYVIDVSLSNNIMKGSSPSDGNNGIYVTYAASGSKLKIWNNIIYDLGGSSSAGIVQVGTISSTRADVYSYNNTISGAVAAFMRYGTYGSHTSKNNIINDCVSSYGGTGSMILTYNVANANIQNAYGGVTADSGNTDGIGSDAYKLRDAGQNFLTTIKTGMIVVNTTDTTYSYVTAVNSDTELTLNDDIMDDSENYLISTNMYGNVTFEDEYNNNFHLDSSDTVAKNKGANLYADASIAVTTDIDNNARQNSATTFDIGADEGATYIYYSVGQNTSDHKTGSPTITLSGYAATLNVGQTAPNMGVGDLITYTGGSCYITSKTNDDKMHWNCQNATGGTAPQVSSVSVTTISHAFGSLASAFGGLGWYGSGHLNTDNLIGLNYILNLPCYYDGGPDTAYVAANSGITGANNYIKIYTPYNTSSEVNVSQRHDGKWNTEKYRLEVEDVMGIWIQKNHYRVDGLQIATNNPTGNDKYAIRMDNGSAGEKEFQISNNIIRGHGSASYSQDGIEIFDTQANAKIWNNILYNFNTTQGRPMMLGVNKAYIYNNTANGGSVGIRAYSGTVIAKNNIVQGATDGYSGTFSSGSDYNISNVAADTTGGAHDKANTTVTFISLNDKNFHLSLSDTAAKNQGIKLASYSDDSNLNFQTDIDENSRTGNWSIGADDGPFAEAQQSRPLDMQEGLNNGLVMYQSFDGDDMNGIGIGGTALDKSGNGNNGILGGTAPGPAKIEGKRGQALKFDGTDDYVKTANSAFITNTSDIHSVFAWVKPSVNNVTQVIWDYGEYNDYNLASALGIYSNGHLGWAYNGILSPGGFSDSGFTVPTGTWSFVGFVRSGNNISLYVNGQVYLGTNSNEGTVNLNPFLIGVTANNTTLQQQFNGLIDEVRVYNRALSTAEIGNLYRMGGDTINASQAGKNMTGLVGHWTFDGGANTKMIGTGGTAYDSSGNNNTGQISGATQVEGKLGQALSFKSSGDYIKSTNLGDAAMTENSPLTISAWFNPKSNVGETYIAQRGSIYLTHYPDHNLFFGVLGGTQLYRLSTDNSINLNSWQHIVVTWDGSLNASNVHFYVNGSAEDGTARDGVNPSDNSSEVLYIGNSYLHNRNLDSSLDDVRIYNRALSSTEIGDLYRMGRVKVKE